MWIQLINLFPDMTLSVAESGVPTANSESQPVVPGNNQPLPPAHQQQDVPVPGHS